MENESIPLNGRTCWLAGWLPNNLYNESVKMYNDGINEGEGGKKAKRLNIKRE